ncbi:Glucose-6-phosphate 1-dehydrogenase [Croceitalea dokdonensis DOKDO 023]|uniref:Glucose-6-phosphate 1-dehydrogenase n=1 Tax=Croceitalea dokdonensis DOKDO 023 TaxID=1300341 RepID=A0A0P7AYI6_9FLAO|nr:glucose-6-phosphate dehydrogenase [Croceitalea dokdonensis]KPM33195.1 Glucose-6-phosphate 1-dehydrogenase [Croceitalea dokdonensis DOKDO 023]
MKKTENQLLVIFGASGDLTARKLVPSLFNLYVARQLPKNFIVLGTSRSDMTDNEFRNRVVLDSKYLKPKLEDLQKDYIEGFSNSFFYEDLGGSYNTHYGRLQKRIEDLDTKYGLDGNVIYYFSTPPTLYQPIAKRLGDVGLNNQQNGWKRVIVEKPFGYDLETAKELNSGLQEHFAETQIYRIDHYLGKETVQNLLVTRFANTIFEPLWNRNYIHHVEVTNAESVGVEKRGGYYDTSGALRDMFQNHLLQIVSLIVMEPPIGDAPEDIRNEKVKALKSLRVMTDPEVLKSHTIRGQYVGSEIKGEKIKGYREEDGVAKDSTTETYAAIKFFVDNWRWKDVPFYVRTAKRMPTKVTEVVIHFKSPHHHIFENSGVNNKDNKLIIRIQPDEGILMKFGVKVPGQGFKVERANLDFYYSSLAETRVMEAYERLLLDCMQGDATLYARSDEVEAAWQFVDPILTYWNKTEDVRMYGYAAGVWGPENADELIEGIGYWRNPSENLADDPGYCVIC